MGVNIIKNPKKLFSIAGTSSGNVVGGITATAGLIPFGTGVANTLTTSSLFKWDSSNNALLVGGNYEGWPVTFYGSGSILALDTSGAGTHLAFLISGAIRSYIGATSTQSLTVYDNTANHLWLNINNSDGLLSTKAITANSASGVDVRLSDWSGNPAIYLLFSNIANTSNNFAIAGDGVNTYLNTPSGELRFKIGGSTLALLTTNGSIVTKQCYSDSTTPAIVAGAGAGTAPTVSITGTNQSGTISVTAGSTPTAGGIVCTVTLSGGFAFPTELDAFISPASSDAVLASAVFCVDTSTSTFKIQEGTALGLSTGKTYVWKYYVTGK